MANLISKRKRALTAPLNLVEEIFAIRSRGSFSHDDIKVWTIKVFNQLFDIAAIDLKTEVVIYGKTKGRADIIAEDYIGIETKKSMEIERPDALIQVERFLEKYEKETTSSMPIGIATDGEVWEFFVRVHERLFSFHSFTIQRPWSDEDLKQALWRPLTTIRDEKGAWKHYPSAEAIADVFRPDGPVFLETRALMIAAMENILKKDPIEFTSKFTSWFELFSYVYNNFEGRCVEVSKQAVGLSSAAKILKKNPLLKDLKGDTITGAIELFIRHTYLAMLSKVLVSTATLGDHQISKQLIDDPASIASGKLLIGQGIFVAEPNDFFVWISYDEEVRKIVAAVLHPLRRFSRDYSDDVFRHLYEIVVDPDTRHELGEFFTPKWLAQLVVEDTIKDYDARILDPACGSGTFLVSALKQKVKLAKKKGKTLKTEDASKLLEQIWGIDVNPLSVILARTNLYLALMSLLKIEEFPEEVHPSVYAADTFILPRFSKEVQNALEADPSTEIIRVPVTPGITIPIHLKLDVKALKEYVERIGDRIERGLPEIAKSEIKGGNADYIVELDRAMRDLRTRYGDNLWQFILRNYCIPPMIRNQFDVVVGNPPWLIYREAKKNIQETIESVGKYYDVSPDVKVKTSFNLAVSFLLTSLQFLRAGGILGFVMPLSAIESAAHHPFLNALVSNRLGSLVGAYDLSKVLPAPFPHALAPCVLIVEAKEA